MHCWLTGWLGDVILSRSDSERQQNLMIHDQRPLPVYFSQLEITFWALDLGLFRQYLDHYLAEEPINISMPYRELDSKHHCFKHTFSNLRDFHDIDIFIAKNITRELGISLFQLSICSKLCNPEVPKVQFAMFNKSAKEINLVGAKHMIPFLL